MNKLVGGDRVIYRLNGKKFHGTVADYLPMKSTERAMEIPVFKRN